tara:strand:- start:1346 stop:1549 length:204 start_codon:yes stop_codon:yes gene_type:complete
MNERIKRTWGSLPRRVRMELASGGWARNKNDWENLGETMKNQLFNVYSDTTRYPAYPERKKRKPKIK